MKRCVVTGASGFVGANLARLLLREGHETHLLLRGLDQPWRLTEIASDVSTHKVDLTDREAVRSTITSIKPDWVFHLAAYGAYSTQTGFDRMVATNVIGCAALLDASAECGVEAFVQTGSSSEYGYLDHPARENDLIEPNSHYAITKAAATHYCQFTARKLGLNALTVRLYSIYGPYEEPTRLIPTLIVKGLRGQLPRLVSPSTARDFVHVDDATEALLLLASGPPPSLGAVFNICSGVQTTLESVVKTTCRLMRISTEPSWATMPPRSWDTDVWVGSPASMTQSTGWLARIEFETGLKRTIEWFYEHPEWLQLYNSRIFSS